jgi:uncharacterized protein YbcV (DUF1398 family)
MTVHLLIFLIGVSTLLPFVSPFKATQKRPLYLRTLKMATTNPGDKLSSAFSFAQSVRPKVGGFPIFAEALRKRGFKRNLWHLPSCSSLYETDFGNFVQQMPSLVNELAEVSMFDRDSLIKAIRADQAGETSFPEFLSSVWAAGVVSYEVDFEARTCTYFGLNNHADFYEELYPAIELPDQSL